MLKTEPGEAVRFLVPRLTPRMNRKLLDELPTIDALLRLNQIDEASVRIDRIVFGKHLSVAEIDSIRSILSALRSRRLMRGKTAKANRLA